MEHVKYSSIENSYRTGFINKIIQAGFANIEWVQTLKIHGSSYSYNINDEGIIPATRNYMLNPLNNNFYWGNDYSANVRAMFQWAQKVFSGLKVMTVFGEVFGGMYNHPDVTKDKHAKRYQKEVQYAPHNDFCAFDIRFDGKYVDYTLFHKMCQLFEIPTVPELARGTMNELMPNPVEFPDPLHKRWNLPEIEGNNAEGWVIKPIEVKYLGNGNRVILKGKNPNFKECKERTPKPSLELDDITNDMKEKLFSYITENRLHNVVSHGNIYTDKDFGKLLGELAQDAFLDFLKDYADEWSAVDAAQCHVITKLMNKECGVLIKTHWFNIMDGEF